jgi:hypothetical protein
MSTDANKIDIFPRILFRCPLPGQSFDCCRFPIWELLPLTAHGFEQFWILKRIAENKILLVYSYGWGSAARTCYFTTSTQSSHAATRNKWEIVDRGLVGWRTKGEIPLYASPGSGMEQGTGCGCGLDPARPFSHEITAGIDCGKSLQIRRRGPVDSKKRLPSFHN